jgi:hypothetical protein
MARESAGKDACPTLAQSKALRQLRPFTAEDVFTGRNTRRFLEIFQEMLGEGEKSLKALKG